MTCTQVPHLFAVLTYNGTLIQLGHHPLIDIVIDNKLSFPSAGSFEAKILPSWALTYYIVAGRHAQKQLGMSMGSVDNKIRCFYYH